MKTFLPTLLTALVCIYASVASQTFPSMETYVSELGDWDALSAAATTATSDTISQLKAFHTTYHTAIGGRKLAYPAEAFTKTMEGAPPTSANSGGFRAKYSAAGRRKLTGAFTCAPAFAAFSPWSMCSDVVDYPFLLLDTDTLADLEAAVRAAVPSTHGFMDNTCLSDYKRMICAQVYLPCVADGTFIPIPFCCLFPIFTPFSSFCKSRNNP